LIAKQTKKKFFLIKIIIKLNILFVFTGLNIQQQALLSKQSARESKPKGTFVASTSFRESSLRKVRRTTFQGRERNSDKGDATSREELKTKILKLILIDF
jgi:hypothetical protein